jgi:hypothetical protein
MLNLTQNIPWSGAKNQMEFVRGWSLYHKGTLLCDLSDEISSAQQIKTIAD